MPTIFHIIAREDWERAQEVGIYRADSLEKQGFIHCATADTVTLVANKIYHGVRDLVLLCIDEARVRAAVRYEPVGAYQFPHIYGPLNLDAVDRVVDFPPRDDGNFDLPSGV